MTGSFSLGHHRTTLRQFNRDMRRLARWGSKRDLFYRLVSRFRRSMNYRWTMNQMNCYPSCCPSQMKKMTNQTPMIRMHRRRPIPRRLHRQKSGGYSRQLNPRGLRIFLRRCMPSEAYRKNCHPSADIPAALCDPGTDIRPANGLLSHSCYLGTSSLGHDSGTCISFSILLFEVDFDYHSPKKHCDD